MRRNKNELWRGLSMGLATVALLGSPGILILSGIAMNGIHRTTPAEREVSRFAKPNDPIARCLGENAMRLTFADGHTSDVRADHCPDRANER